MLEAGGIESCPVETCCPKTMTGCDNLEIGDYIGKQMTEIEYMFDY